jgi:hypothetical protein
MPDNDPRLREALERLLEQDGAPAPPNGPIANPVDRFAHLPEPTRKWLEELRAEDVDDVRRLLQVFRNARTNWNFLKRVVLTVAGAFMAVVAFSKGVPEIMSWFKR